MQSSGQTKYEFTRSIILDYFKESKNLYSNLETIPQTGNFEEDVKTIDNSGIETSIIKKAITELDNQKKLKNSIKKGGAFHEENCMIDIRSLVTHGKPDFHELKYHMDWWLQMGLLTNVLARRGVNTSKRTKEFLEGFSCRNEPSTSKSSFSSSITKQRVKKSRLNKYGDES